MNEWLILVIGFLLGFIVRGDWRRILKLINDWRKNKSGD